MYLHRQAEQQPKHRNCSSHPKERSSGRFRTDRCAHFGCYPPSSIVGRHPCRSTRHPLRRWTRMALTSSQIWKIGDMIAKIALVPPFAAWWRCRWRTGSSSQDQGNDPLVSTLRCCVKSKWILFKTEISEEHFNEWIDWHLLSCCTVQRWADPQLLRRQDRSSSLPIHFQDRLNVALHSCGREQLCLRQEEDLH